MYELWGTCFPDTELEQRVCDQWKQLGFQGKDPATDFRGMGLLGLKHILYFAKTYTKIFVEMASTQNSRSSHYYPVSTAGINISSMLLEILQIGKGKSDNKAVVGGVVTGGGPPSDKDKKGKKRARRTDRRSSLFCLTTTMRSRRCIAWYSRCSIEFGTK